ncbi:hypothetical protein AX15_002516 [Amanita polypyramis BW_CC]|nr:hypothetical protein AX15_002516 [Amanita polypyramis BW_CC]
MYRTFQVFASKLPLPSSVPAVHYEINNYLVFSLNVPAIHYVLYILYYFMLEPVAALLYLPQMTLSLLTATAFSRGSAHITQAAILHAVSWIAQFIGHGFAEKRSPALLDNLVGATPTAVVLAPFFVHLEILFKLGYRPDMHRRINNGVAKEIVRFRKLEGDKKRAAAAKNQ